LTVHHCEAGFSSLLCLQKVSESLGNVENGLHVALSNKQPPFEKM